MNGKIKFTASNRTYKIKFISAQLTKERSIEQENLSILLLLPEKDKDLDCMRQNSLKKLCIHPFFSGREYKKGKCTYIRTFIIGEHKKKENW